MGRRSLALGLCVLMMVVACRRRDDGAATPVPAPVGLEVTNDYSLQMEIEVTGAGARHRLGIVNPGMVARFVVPRDMVGIGGVEIIARPIGGDGFVARSGTITLAEGAQVEFVIRQPLFNSTTIIR